MEEVWGCDDELRWRLCLALEKRAPALEIPLLRRREEAGVCSGVLEALFRLSDDLASLRVLASVWRVRFLGMLPGPEGFCGVVVIVESAGA